MNEQLRQAYLQTMGITPLYPRMPVPGAQASPGYDFSCPDFLAIADDVAPESEQGDSQTTVAGSTKASGGEKQVRTQSAREHLGLGSEPRRSSPKETDSRSPNVAGRENAAEASAVTASEVQGEALRFRLEYRRVSESLAVLIEVPLHAQPELTRQSAQLLENILLALDVRPAQNTVVAENFNWPLLEDLPIEETSARHATQALLGFVAMRQQRDGFANLLLFMNQSGQLVDLLPAGEGALDYRQERLGCWITRVSSLQEMLSAPAMKREVWQQLQPLRKRLQAG